MTDYMVILKSGGNVQAWLVRSDTEANAIRLSMDAPAALANPKALAGVTQAPHKLETNIPEQWA